jgi:thiamine-phosphate kinase
MDKESLIISKFKNNFIGDDAAVIGNLTLSKDLFIEDTHFKLDWLSLDEIGYKAVIVNFSDCIVMNAVPKYVLLGLGVPKNMSIRQINELQNGIKRACNEFGAVIIGGDTISSEKIIISISVVAKLIGKAVFRNYAKNGDFVAFTGKLGESLKGLNSLFRCGVANSRFKRPILKSNFFYKIAKNISAAMDISDGLESDLNKLCAASKCGIKFTKKLSKAQMISGEEYEILFTFSQKNRAKILNLAKKTRTKITIFGKITKGKFKTNAKQHHF